MEVMRFTKEKGLKKYKVMLEAVNSYNKHMNVTRTEQYGEL